VLVNREFVRRCFPGKSPLGIQIKLDNKSTAPVWSEIVGVVSDVKSYSEETRVDPEVYESLFQRPVSSFSVMLRSTVEPNALIPALRQAVAHLDRELPLARVMSMDSVINDQRNGDPLFSGILAIFAMFALILAAIGIYGLVTYSVGQRTHEIGIRIALGAKASDILRMILRDGFKTAAIGSALGLAIALPLPKLFESLFQGIRFVAPELHLMTLAAILLVTLFAIYLPALRAAHVDPKAALHNQ
jgi:predicted lysophospholipase L1 biosynthesis ABC-type transport system permease subunit